MLSRDRVSIPQWFDLKDGRVILNLSIIPWFQFHNGSIKSV